MTRPPVEFVDVADTLVDDVEDLAIPALKFETVNGELVLIDAGDEETKETPSH